MFSRDGRGEMKAPVTPVAATKAAAATTAAAAAATATAASDARRNANRSRMPSPIAGGGGLSRTLSTPPIAESTHIGSFSPGPSSGSSNKHPGALGRGGSVRGDLWNGTGNISIGNTSGQFKRKPTSPLSNSRTLFKSSGNLSIFGRANSQIFTDAQSPGLVNRLVRYSERSAQSGGAMNRSQSLSSVYSKPGQFPVVHLRKQELRYGLGGGASHLGSGSSGGIRRRGGNFSAIRIPPPDMSLFQVNKRSSILRTGSLLIPASAETHETSTTGGNSSSSSSTTTLFGGGGRGVKSSTNEADAMENRVITPCAELEATPTRSVLDALKEISRKRINSEELDADRIKKQCKELSELDSAGSGPPSSSSTGAVATGTFGLATKRSRDPGSPSSPSTLDGGAGGSGASGTTVAVGSSGSYLGLGGLAPGELQVSKKRFCSKNNDILSSLSSSISSSHTPNRYRIAVPRMDHRLAMVGSPSISFSNSSILGSMPSTSSTPIAEAIQELAAKELATRNDRETAASQRAIKSASYAQQQQQQPSWKQKTPPSERPTVSEPQGRTQPKITLFNRPYETSTTKKLPVSSLATTTSDGEEDEHSESSGRVQFVKPKERMSPLGVKSGASGGVGGAAGTGSNSDPLKKPPASKLSVMLKCLSGDLGEEDEEEEEEDEEQQQQQTARESPKTPKPQPQATQAVAPSGLPKSSFTFGGLASAKDTVDATSKITGASTEATKTTSKDETVAKGPSTVGSGIAALINNPIKDAGLGKIVQPEIKETSGTAAEKPKSAAPAAAASAPAVAFTFGIPAATTTTSSGAAATTVSNTTDTANKTTLTSATFKAPEGGAAATLPSAPAAPFTFGTPLKQPASSSTASSSTVTSPSTNFISFSPAPTAPTAAAAAGGFGGTTFGGALTKAASPVVQFGAGNAATTTSTTASGTEKTTAAAPIFSFGAASSPAASVATSSTIASPSSVPSFGAGSTFSAFKSPAAPAVPAAPAGTPTAPAAATFSFGSVATASSASTAASTTTSSSILPPVFGSLSSGNTASTAAPAAPTPGSTFTFGSALKTSNATSATPAATTAAPATGAFTFGAAALAPTTTAASAPAAAAPASSTTTSTFPTFGGTTTAQQPFTFGGAAASAPAAPTNLFASAASNNNNTSNTPATATTNLFGATLASSPKTTTESPASSTAASPNLFGTPAQPSAPATGSVFGRLAPAAASATGTNGANSNSNTPAAPAVFSFGAVKPSTGTPSAGGSVAAAPSLATNGQNIFGAAAAQSGAPGGGVTGGLFTFGATQQNTAQSQAPQNATGGVPTFGSGLPSSNPLAGQPTAVAANKPFTFGSTAAAKPPTAVGVSASPSPAQTATPGTGIFGQQQQQQQQQAPSPFGASSQQQSSVPAFGSPVFGGNAGATNTAAPTQTTGTIFGQAAQVNGGTTNGPNTAGNLFTFGAKTPVASSTPAVGTTFGAPANSNTFGSVATGGLSNGLGQQQQQQQQTNKPFTFGAQASAPTAVTAQPGQVQTTSTGGFNFNLGSNVAPVAKPFSFTAGAANSAASPPVFGAPAAVAPTVNAGSPFTFGAAANNNNNAGIGQPASNASAAPFTFGSTQQPQQQQQQPNAASPFSFSAGNVATVAPQPQQHQQQQQPGVAAPFTFNAGGGGGGAFGAAPVFGAPAGIPTFSIGTSSTPNGPTAGQRRIKTATRRIK
uniref:Putative mucin-19 n=1 Tax=Anopheles darlingi TaxID=43151 RepID=A0A2M4CR44_ANODA